MGAPHNLVSRGSYIISGAQFKKKIQSPRQRWGNQSPLSFSHVLNSQQVDNPKELKPLLRDMCGTWMEVDERPLSSHLPNISLHCWPGARTLPLCLSLGHHRRHSTLILLTCTPRSPHRRRMPEGHDHPLHQSNLTTASTETSSSLATSGDREAKQSLGHQGIGSRGSIISVREVGKLWEARPHTSHDSKPSLYICSIVPLNFNYKT